MFINPKLLKTATFLVVNGEPISTVFFIKLYHPAYYAVTTFHSIKDRAVSIRFNLARGGTEDKPIEPHEWIPHESTDVAILPLDLDAIELEKFDLEFVSADTLAESKDYIENPVPPADSLSWLMPSSTGASAAKDWSMTNIFGLAYGTGDEVFTVGLFEGHHGQSLAQPLARFGHIAMKPATGEKILAEIDPEPAELKPIDAFLVEIAAWKGQSGSPVFIRTNVKEERLGWPTRWSDYLIGVIQGFYPCKQELQTNAVNATILLNMGIAIVIPAVDIKELLMHPDVLEKRQQRLKEKQQRPRIRPSAASLPE